ncbi:salicylate hydroxylase [Lineolata rhizophorae]|uniref:Salicylate hydroxylase n=1 Tax=Lineolata rhizophorae TaxID=578093 RepID=A0A6A6NYU5_9PEZI|nr:salicylate hydroxylase [Lineolata rhizophorae]
MDALAQAPLNVVVVGAGIGGMAAALSLGRRGHSVTVLETAPKLLEIGAGIQVAPNMFRLLERWGAGEALRKTGCVVRDVSLLRYERQKLLGRSPMNTQYGQQYVVHRADLHNAIVDKALELPNVRLRLNATVDDVDFDQTTVVLKGGEVVAADVILAADGIKSIIRGKVLQDSEDVAIPTGDAVFRVMLTRDQMVDDPELRPFIDEERATRWMGPNRHIIAYPVRNHQMYNIVLAHPQRKDLDESWTAVGSKKSMLEEYAGWDPRLVKMLDMVPEGDVLEWKLCSHLPLAKWVRGNVALMGDACHPMLPYVAQGAAQAVEDAACLGVVLSSIRSKSDLPLALKTYVQARKTRAERVQSTGTETRTQLHLVDGEEQIERDRKFASLSVDGVNPDQWGDPKMQEYLWAWDAEEDARQAWQAATSGLSMVEEIPQAKL